MSAAGVHQSSDRPSAPSTITPAPAPPLPDENVPIVTTTHPLFALSPNLRAADRSAAPGQLLFKLSKSLNVEFPMYGVGDSAKRICFNFTTDGCCKCAGTLKAGKHKRCYRLHISLEPDSPQRSDPAAYFKDILHFLQAPGVNDFIPSDEFTTSQLYRDALVASL
jgi:hypothetical protein